MGDPVLRLYCGEKIKKPKSHHQLLTGSTESAVKSLKLHLIDHRPELSGEVKHLLRVVVGDAI